MKNGCILKGGVGSGKSITAIAYWEQNHRTKDIYIITTATKRNKLEWDAEVARFGLTKGNREDSYGNVLVTVDSWNNITDYIDRRDAFFIFDEQRLVGSGAWVKAFLKIAENNSWIILSATPGDNWMDYIPVFVANGFYKNRTEFLRTHVVWKQFAKFPTVDHYVETSRLYRLRQRILVAMPDQRHTVRHPVNVTLPYGHATFDRVWKDRWHIYEDRPLKDAGEMCRVARQVVNSDPSRLDKVIELAQQHPKLIVFYNFNYELERLRILGEALGCPVAEWNGQKHQPIPAGDKWIYLVQFTAGAEGWNCIDTDAMVFYSLPYSYKIFEQAQGRIDRLNTPFTDLHYYMFRSGSRIDQMVMKALREKRDFNESEVSF
jgi:hypothetical protein